MKDFRIRPFAAADAPAFRDLNLAWLNAYFHVEPKDAATLSNPQGTILAPGGEIFVAESENGTVTGCVALLPMANGSYEVAKMAVAREVQGRGVGRKLLAAAVDWARAQGAKRLYLESNSRLAPALRLYESAGFRHLSKEERTVSPYARADVFMELRLTEDLAEEAARRRPGA